MASRSLRTGPAEGVPAGAEVAPSCLRFPRPSTRRIDPQLDKDHPTVGPECVDGRGVRWHRLRTSVTVGTPGLDHHLTVRPVLLPGPCWCEVGGAGAEPPADLCTGSAADPQTRRPARLRDLAPGSGHGQRHNANRAPNARKAPGWPSGRLRCRACGTCRNLGRQAPRGLTTEHIIASGFAPVHRDTPRHPDTASPGPGKPTCWSNQRLRRQRQARARAGRRQERVVRARGRGAAEPR